MTHHFSVGDTVQLLDSSQVGHLAAIQDKVAIVDFQTITLKVAVSLLCPTKNPSKASRQPPTNKKVGLTRPFDIHQFKAFSPEIDLHGLFADQALQRLDYWIDQALVTGHTYLRIIHGKGRGLLRQRVYDYLSTHKSIKKIMQEHPWRGGDGITCIEIKH